VVDKPEGPTSHDVVAQVRRRLGVARVGHTGTLDPFATGVLVLCLGKATRLSRFLAAADKTYRARVRLGFATTTDDRTGEPLGPQVTVAPEEGELRGLLAGMTGRQMQVPPAFSAKHVEGRRLHELARAGRPAVAAPVPVRIEALELLGLEGDRLELLVRCSAGTYVRSIARDLGRTLGCGAHLEALRRTASGGFDLAAAVPLATLEETVPPSLCPLARLLPELPAVRVNEVGLAAVRHGRVLGLEQLATALPPPGTERVRVLSPQGDALLALAVLRPGGTGDLPLPAQLHPDVVLLG